MTTPVTLSDHNYSLAALSARDQLTRELAERLLENAGDFEKAKDALLKAAGMYSQAVADWPDGHGAD